jgi:hypothetical protein
VKENSGIDISNIYQGQGCDSARISDIVLEIKDHIAIARAPGII